MQTPLHSLFYQGGSSSQHPQPQPPLKQLQPPLEAKPKRNPVHNRRYLTVTLIPTIHALIF
ncbi:hypothetical protein Godav_004624 [Gossypium davidsonii]|uniref:Uncharacterized protein n=1 Tax=Gossypium davidsonii TaxID=34287 RepID=A0A7J8SLX3_GOSDV|nr:hypothetical protein [Gossypium davidsonii]